MIDEIDKLSRKMPIVKKNPLIQAQFDLTAIEYKIILAALSKINPSLKIIDSISFEIKEFCDLLKVQKKGMYTYLKDACDKLIRRVVTIEHDKNDWIKFSWLHSIKYKNGVITLKFHSQLEPYLLFCKENKSYTKYLLENVIDMNSKYSIRIFELTKQYEKIGYRIFELDELKQLLGIPKTKYKQLSHFRNKVLNPSKEEVNGLSDINIDFELIKVGRKVEKIKYIIKSKAFMLDNKTQYDLFPKLKLVSSLRKKINDLTGVIIDFKTIEKYHKVVLIELLKKFDTGAFNKVLIGHPKNFFVWHLDSIKEMFDLRNIPDI